jgi:type II secretory pathway pseudopilin PulG
MTRPPRTKEGRSGGFTVIEMMIAITLAGFAFAAVASVMISSLKALSVQKARTQGNEFATRGIEDLQRLDFDRLAFCNSAAGGSDPSPAFVPDTLKDSSGTALPTVTASGSCNTATYSDPCHAAASTLVAVPVPRQVYTCARNNIAYTVNRYIVWADAARTNKRLAVFVDWTDSVGVHRVAQHSSLRIPNPASIYGGPPPQFLSANATGSATTCGAIPATLTCVSIDATGVLTSSLTLDATTTGLAATDSITVNLQTITAGATGDTAIATSIPLTPDAAGSSWSTVLTSSSGFRVQPGDQVLFLTAARNTDGKVNSRFITNKPVRFCSPTSCGPVAGSPVIQNVTVPGSTIDIDSTGVLQGTATFQANVQNVVSGDTVSMSLQTVKGAVLLPMQNVGSCAGSNCSTWRIILSSATGYRFASGSQSVYFTATKQPSGGSLGSSTIYSPAPQVAFE